MSFKKSSLRRLFCPPDNFTCLFLGLQKFHRPVSGESLYEERTFKSLQGQRRDHVGLQPAIISKPRVTLFSFMEKKKDIDH